jgi:hypothetical protein
LYRYRCNISNIYETDLPISCWIENLVTHFKNNNEEYLKIKQEAYEEVKSLLTDGKLLLKSLLSVIESLRSNPELCNFLFYNISNNYAATPYGSNYLSLMSPGRQQYQQSFNDSYTALILQEAEELYNKLTTELTNSVIAAAAIMESSLPPANNNIQKLNYQNEYISTRNL